MDHHPQDETFRRLPENSELLRDHAVTIDDDPVAHALQHILRRTSERQDVVLLVEFVARVHDSIRHVSVVGQEEESLGVAIEPADWVNPLRDLDDVHDGAPVPLVLRRRDVATRFVQDEITWPLRPQQLSVDADLGANRIGSRAELGHDLAVDAHPSGRDQRLRRPPRSDAASGENPL
jgi:hypothetical protein